VIKAITRYEISTPGYFKQETFMQEMNMHKKTSIGLFCVPVSQVRQERVVWSVFFDASKKREESVGCCGWWLEE
jgi:hypothetical protein